MLGLKDYKEKKMGERLGDDATKLQHNVVAKSNNQQVTPEKGARMYEPFF